MAYSEDERTRLLVRVARMYYESGLNQEQIARAMKISRPQISRLLAEAQAVGIVQITINDPFSSKTDLEVRLAEAFGLKEAVVASTASEVSSARAGVSASAADLLERLISDGDRIGVNAGNTLSDTCEAVRGAALPDCSVVPLVGGWGPSGSRWQANLSARTLAERLGCSYLQLNAPAFVSAARAREALVAESEIESVLALGRECSVALVGIGQLTEESTLLQTGFLKAEHLHELERVGAVANICNSFVDQRGRLVEFSGYERMIGLAIDDLERVPAIVGVAAGPEKVAAVHAALSGGWLHYFVTDARTAEAVLGMERGALDGKPGTTVA